MPTPNERKALLFLAVVTLLGTVTRVVYALREPPSVATAESRAALAQQIALVDSARRRGAGRAAGRGGRRRATAGAVAVDSAPVAETGGARDASQGFARAPAAPSPSPVYALPAVPGAAGRAGSGRKGEPGAPVDVDVASVVELEALPRVGPALARRIVASRDSLGAFGSVAGLRRVRGVGPAVAAGLAPYVTFSGRVRQSDANGEGVRDALPRRSFGRRSRP